MALGAPGVLPEIGFGHAVVASVPECGAGIAVKTSVDSVCRSLPVALALLSTFSTCRAAVAAGSSAGASALGPEAVPLGEGDGSRSCEESLPLSLDVASVVGVGDGRGVGLGVDVGVGAGMIDVEPTGTVSMLLSPAAAV